MGIFSVHLLSFDLFFASAAHTYITFPPKAVCFGTYSSVTYFVSSESLKNFLKRVTWSSITQPRFLPCIGHVQVVWVAIQLRKDVTCIL